MPAPSEPTATLVLGDVEITRISSGIHRWDGGAFFGVVPKTLWSRKAAADELNRIPVAFNSYHVRTPRHSILIETGCGDKPDARARERMAMPPEHVPLASVLRDHAIDPDSVDLVVNSHLHWDH